MNLLPVIIRVCLGLFVAAITLSSQAQNPSPVSTVAETKTATFAGGCFWCMQAVFDRVPGVKKTVVGYTGGKKDFPDYEEVSSGDTGHAESIEVVYDPAVTTFEKLLDVFWKNIDPTALNRQFADQGTQYRTAIFYHSDEQRQAAEASKAALAKSGKFDKPIVTQIVPAGRFYAAEEYHQGYYKKNALHFNSYESLSGRLGYLKRTWGASTEEKH